MLLGCVSKTINKIKTSCPSVLFATEHRNYIVSNSQPITLDNKSYQAEINNYAFVKGCVIVDQILESELSLLFIVKPDKAQKNIITLPFYVAILDINNELIDTQYYQLSGSFKIDKETKKFVETDFIKTITLKINSIDQDYKKNTVVVGFMLDKKKLEVLN